MENCKDMSGDWVAKKDIMSSLAALYSVKCPPGSFLQEMNIASDETQYQMNYKCCTYTAVLKN